VEKKEKKRGGMRRQLTGGSINREMRRKCWKAREEIEMEAGGEPRRRRRRRRRNKIKEAQETAEERSSDASHGE